MFTIVGGKTEFTQWSQGEKVTHEKLSAGDRVKFTNRSGRVITMTADANGEVSVPNVFLKECADILVSIVGKPETRHKFDVVSAEKPDGWCDVDNSITHEYNGLKGELVWSGVIKANRQEFGGDGEVFVVYEVCMPTIALPNPQELLIVWDGVTYKTNDIKSWGLLAENADNITFTGAPLDGCPPFGWYIDEEDMSTMQVATVDDKPHTLAIYTCGTDDVFVSAGRREIFDPEEFLSTLEVTPPSMPDGVENMSFDVFCAFVKHAMGKRIMYNVFTGIAFGILDIPNQEVVIGFSLYGVSLTHGANEKPMVWAQDMSFRWDFEQNRVVVTNDQITTVEVSGTTTYRNYLAD